MFRDVQMDSSDGWFLGMFRCFMFRDVQLALDIGIPPEDIDKVVRKIIFNFFHTSTQFWKK